MFTTVSIIYPELLLVQATEKVLCIRVFTLAMLVILSDTLRTSATKVVMEFVLAAY